MAEARDFDERIERSLNNGSFVALSVAPKLVLRAAKDLADRFNLEVKDLDAMLIAELKKEAESRRVDWNEVLKADAEGPTGRHWSKLLMLVKVAIEQVEQQLLSTDRPVLLLYPGLAARYEQLQFLEHLRDGSGRSGSVPGLCLLVASDHQSTLPTIDGRPVPVLGHGQWAWIPDSWLINKHRAGPESASVAAAQNN
jgi:hypothetical protein